MAVLISLFALLTVAALTWRLTGGLLWPNARADRDTIRRLSKLGDDR
ncbi:hypothetical protein [Nocardiopsis sp. TNDT3]|nr:hypothetical protein [Nocardiopsis sp. TNDT3]